MAVTAEKLRKLFPTGRQDLIDAIVRGWPEAAKKGRLNNKLRAAHFLGQIGTETGGLSILSESGAYSASRISQIFGVGNHSAKVTPAEARAIAALPVARRGPVLFNRVYGIGNPRKAKEFENYGPNDGWLYRGGGMLQNTGRSNYERLAKKTGLPLVEHPELLHQPDSAFKAAWLEWSQDDRANKAADRDDVVTARKIINGGTNGLATYRQYLARAKSIFKDSDFDDLQSPVDEPKPGKVDPGTPDPVIVPGRIAVDPVVKLVQLRLKAMNYNPGVIDGKWGGMTSGALSAFINDRPNLTMGAPTSKAMFDALVTTIEEELTAAEEEGWKRPVSAARASADPKKVAEVAPEVVPVKRNMFAAAWAAVVAFVSAFLESISGYISQVWEFFTAHKDDLPSSESGIVQSLLGYLGKIPGSVWLVMAGSVMAFIAYNSLQGIKRITESVQTGERI